MRKHVHFLVYLPLSILLVACGGGSSDTNSTTNNSNSSSNNDNEINTPSGRILDTSPTFTWEAIVAATEYNLGHEDPRDPATWISYSISPDEASCGNDSVCHYTPSDITLNVGDQRSWWIRAKVSGQFQDWSDPAASFTVIDNSPPILTSTPFVSSNAGQLVSFVSGKCISVLDSASFDSARVVQLECKATPNQLFTLKESNQSGYYFLVAKHSDKCLHVEGGVITNGADIIQQSCNSTYENNLWSLQAASGGGHLLKAKHSDQCMSIVGDSTNDGADIIQSDCENEQNMIFEIGALTTENGKWGAVTSLPLIPAAGSVLNNGNVLLWSSYNTMMFGGDFGFTQTAILNPTTGQVSQVEVNNTQHDMFCPGISTLADGRVMVTGGSSAARTSIYDPASAIWSTGGEMNFPRGYHSSAVLADGSVMVAGGSWKGGIFDKGVEIYKDNQWDLLDNIPTLPMLGDDPRGQYRSDNHLWLFPWTNNRVFQAGPSKKMHWISTSGEGSITFAGNRANDLYAMNGNAIMYEPGKILTVGGATAYDNGIPSENAHIININGSTVSTKKITSMARPRAFHNSVVLPTGEVVILGGVGARSKPFADAAPVMTAELFNPDTETFTPLAHMQVPRTYHSIALLLADARILTAGGGLCGDCQTNHANYEIYTPPYLLDTSGNEVSRPRIESAPHTANINQNITVRTNQDVDEFVLIRTASVTHSVNTDQRRIPVSSQKVNDSYQVTMPSDPGIAIPGDYFLFALKNGVPSIASMLRL